MLKTKTKPKLHIIWELQRTCDHSTTSRVNFFIIVLLNIFCRYKDKTGRAPATNLVQVDTLKAQRLLGKKPDIPDQLQIVPNLMSISYHLDTRGHSADRHSNLTTDRHSTGDVQRSGSMSERSRTRTNIKRSESVGSRAEMKKIAAPSTAQPVPPPRKNSIPVSGIYALF